MVLGLIVLLPFLGSLAAAFLPPHSRDAASWLAGLVALACALLGASLYPAVADGDVARLVLPWMPQYGLALSLRMDGFAWLFTMLVAGMGALVVLYARYYMSSADPVPRFFSFLLAFMGAMLGIVLSGNLVQLDSGEVAVVLKPHAPDPYRPQVRVLIDRDGQPMATPPDLNLWELPEGESRSIVKPLDPAEYGIDPLVHL